MPVTSDAETGAVLLAHRVYALLNEVEGFTGVELTFLRPRVLEAAIGHAAILRVRDGREVSERLAADMCKLLFGNEHPEPGFWASDLGADVAWHIGYPLPEVPVWAAAAVLRVGRQTVWRHTSIHGDFTPETLRERARKSRKLRIK